VEGGSHGVEVVVKWRWRESWREVVMEWRWRESWRESWREVVVEWRWRESGRLDCWSWYVRFQSDNVNFGELAAQHRPGTSRFSNGAFNVCYRIDVMNLGSASRHSHASPF
jgi:hypothetical protein